MRLRENEVRRHERNSSRHGRPEEAVGFGMVLIAPAPQRDPRPTIDEERGGSGDGR